MSVRVADRGLSKMEYVHNAQQIVFLVNDRITKYMNKVSNDKRYKDFVKASTYSIWNSPIFHAQLVFKYCEMFYQEKQKNKRDTNILFACLSKANKNLNLLESSTQTFYAKFESIVKDKFISLLTSKIDYQRSLLDGCKRAI